MAAIDEIRKLLQDFLAPELRSISVRLDAMEKRIDANHAMVMTAIAQLAETSLLKERMAALEAKTAVREKHKQ